MYMHIGSVKQAIMTRVAERETGRSKSCYRYTKVDIDVRNMKG